MVVALEKTPAIEASLPRRETQAETGPTWLAYWHGAQESTGFLLDQTVLLDDLFIREIEGIREPAALAIQTVSQPWGSRPGAGSSCVTVGRTSDKGFLELVFRVPVQPGLIAGPPGAAGQPVADAVNELKASTGLSDERLAALLGITRPTLWAWQQGKGIFDAHRRRLFAVRAVIREVASRHGPRDRLVEWLDSPYLPDGRTAGDALEAGDLNRARFLISTRPAGAARPRQWARRIRPLEFATGEERIGEDPADDGDKMPAYPWLLPRPSSGQGE